MGYHAQRKPLCCHSGAYSASPAPEGPPRHGRLRPPADNRRRYYRTRSRLERLYRRGVPRPVQHHAHLQFSRLESRSFRAPLAFKVAAIPRNVAPRAQKAGYRKRGFLSPNCPLAGNGGFCLLAERDILSRTGGRKAITPQVGSRMASTIEACSCLLRREGRRSQTDAGRTLRGQ